MDDLGLGGFDAASMATQAASSLGTVILWLLLVVLILAIAGLGWYLSTFKHKVRVRKIVKGRTITIDDKARETKDKDGAIWWVFLKTKIKTLSPPDEAVDISKRGKLITEGYLIKDGRFIWRVDTLKEDEIIKATDSVRGDHKLFTSEERALYAKEIRDSEKYKKKSISDLLVAAAPYIAIIMIFALFLIFFGEVVAPSKELGEMIKGTVSDQRETVTILRDIIQNRQSLLLENVSAPN